MSEKNKLYEGYMKAEYLRRFNEQDCKRENTKRKAASESCCDISIESAKVAKSQ